MSDLQLYLNADATPAASKMTSWEWCMRACKPAKTAWRYQNFAELLLQFVDVTAHIVTCILKQKAINSIISNTLKNKYSMFQSKEMHLFILP